ncbi:hypothetical protein ACTK7M_000502 [Escherichia albertii]
MNLLLPLSYLFKSRLITKHEKISWFFIYPIFTLCAVLIFNGDVINFIVAFFMTMSLYEIGYMDNDFRTTKKEKEPTIRFFEGSDWVVKNYRLVVLLRITIASLLCIYLIYNINDNELGLLVFFIIILAIGFYFHNTLRSRWNIFTYFVIVASRYLLPAVASITIPEESLLIIYLIIIFPLPRTLEHACKVKYNFPNLRKIIRNPDVFRVKWYLFLEFVLCLFIIFIGCDFFLINMIILTMYFLLYRIGTLYLSKAKKVLRNKHKSYNWDSNE